jgi:hypothetical protein
MKLFKNATETWLPVGKLGPFSLLLHDKKKKKKQKTKYYDVQVVECKTHNILNIQGSSVLRFEPEQLIFTSKNLTAESSQATIDVFLHSSYPLNLAYPKFDCQVWNRTTEEHAQVMLEKQQEDETSSTDDDKNDDGNDDDDGEWKLVSYFGPLTSKYRPRGNNTNVFLCRATKKGLKVKPGRFVWNSTNYTQAVYVPHYVHSSYPDDQPIPPPKCSFRRDVPLRTAAAADASNSSNSITLQLVGMVMILVMIVILSYLYLFPTTDSTTTKSKKKTKKKSMPLTFSQKLVQKLREGGGHPMLNPGRKDGSWTIVEGPGSRNLMIQWVDGESFVTQLVPKTAEDSTNNKPNSKSEED